MALLVFEHSDAAGSGRLGEVLRDYGHRLHVLRLHDGDSPPPDLDDIDGIISFGGDFSANDDSLDWLAPQMDLMREAHEREMPIVGVCLGCQILTRALGGAVEKNPAGIELGFHEVKLTPSGREDAMHSGIAWTSVQFHHHRDHVAKPPPGGRVLASSAKTKVQAWALGLRTYGFQYHPEATPETIERITIGESHSLAEAGLSPDEMRVQIDRYYATFERLSLRLFESIALFLTPVDRRYQGLVKDLHH